MNKEKIENKTALITGGTYGIGYGIAKELLLKGLNVAITGRKDDSTKSAAEKLAENYPGKVLGVSGDVRSMADMKEIAQKTREKFGKIDALIANAGVGHFGSIEDLTEDQWNQTVETNLTGVFNSVKAALPALIDSKGYIITIASLAGTNFFANGSAYNASKFGLVGFTQAIMLDLRQKGVKVSTIMPGSVTSHFAGHTPSDDDQWKIQPEDLGKMVIDLLEMNPRTLPSKIEVRPSMPPKR